MFSVQNRVHPLNIFKWKRRNKSSLTTGLLDVPQHEIELSDYHQQPSPSSESPSGFLDDGALNADPIDDLDLFLERIYNYYCEKGLWCIIIKWIFELLSLAFTICFSGFFLLFVDWNGLRTAKCGMDAVESGIKPCDLSKEALHEHPLTPLTLSKAIIVGYLGIFTVYWIFCFFRFFAQLKETLKIRLFYYNSLHVTDNEIKTMPWEVILEKLVRVQRAQKLCVVKDLSIHDLVMRLMRKENYLIGMLNKGVLAFPISGWVPGSGTSAGVGPNGVRHRLVLPKTLEWTLNWCILQSMFDRNFHLRRDFTSDPATLKTRLAIVGFVLLLLSPFLIIFMAVYLFLRHAEQFYNHPSTASSRRWSNLSKWTFREFNEVDHLFKHRVNSSVVHASDYLKQFPSPILTIVAKFISFVSGGFAAVLIIIAFLEESLLEGHIFGRNLFWYAAVFGTITAISRAAIADELLVLDPQGTMSQVVQHTHYMPKKWRGKENTEAVRVEFETLFQYTGMMLLEEIASIFVTPYLLIFVVPKRVDDILHFIVDFTDNVPGVGDVCSFSVFNFGKHGNKKYGSPFDSARSERSSQGKMEKSFLSFQISYPSWEPKEDGKQFLATLKLFRDQKFRDQNPNSRRSSTGDFSRDPVARVGNYNQFDSMWLLDGEHANLPYVLDWYYYMSQNHDRDEANATPPRATRSHYNDVPDRDFTWDPRGPARNRNWDGDDVFGAGRGGSHMEASPSMPLFQESILRHHHHEPGKSQWWARSRPQGLAMDPTTSFLEPPDFFNGPTGRGFSGGNFSGRIVEEEEGGGDSDSRVSGELSRTVFMDDLEMGGGFNLPFDIFSRDGDASNLV